MGAAAVAGLDQQLAVRAQEVAVHPDQIPIRQHEVGAVPELLDEAEDVVPAAAVEAGGVLAQLVEDLVHLERRRQGLDEHRGLDGGLGHAGSVLGVDEDVVPQPGLEVALELGQIEVGPGFPGQQALDVVEVVETEIHQAGRKGLAVHLQVALHQVPAPRSHHEDRRPLAQCVDLFPRRVLEADAAVYRIPEVDLSLHDVVPGG